MTAARPTWENRDMYTSSGIPRSSCFSNRSGDCEAFLPTPHVGDQVTRRKAICSRFDDSADSNSDHDTADGRWNVHLVRLQQQPVPRDRVDGKQLGPDQDLTQQEGRAFADLLAQAIRRAMPARRLGGEITHACFCIGAPLLAAIKTPFDEGGTY